MNKLNNCKKSMLFTLSFSFLVMVVLSLAILIFHSSQESEDIVSKLVVLDRVYELDNSIGKSLGDIIILKSGISINVMNDSVSFEESLPNEAKDTFNSSLYGFKKFIEDNISGVNLDISNLEEMPLTITPGDITYKHIGNDWSDVGVLPPAGYSGGYSLFIVTDKNITTCNSNFNAGSFNLSYEVIGIDEDYSCSDTKMINPADNKRVIVTSLQEGNIINIEVNSNGALLINLTKDITITVRTTIPISSPASIMADSLGLNINFGNLGISKTNEVRVI